MNRPTHFDITADDPARAGRFYQNVFGWSVSKWDGPAPFWLVNTGDSNSPGINGGIMPRGDFRQALIATIEVASVDEAVAKITAAQGSVFRPKVSIPGVGHIAYCKDTEGNIFGIIETNTD